MQQQEGCPFSRKRISFAILSKSRANQRSFLYEGEQTSATLQAISKQYPLPNRTCFYVLGLISSTPQGAEVLDEYEWEATVTPLGFTTGLCLPMDVEKFLYVCHFMQYVGHFLLMA